MIISLYVVTPPPRDTLTLKTTVATFVSSSSSESVAFFSSYIQLNQVKTIQITGVGGLYWKNIYSNVVVVFVPVQMQKWPTIEWSKIAPLQPQEILNKVLDTSNQLYPPKYIANCKENGFRNFKKIKVSKSIKSKQTSKFRFCFLSVICRIFYKQKIY